MKDGCYYCKKPLHYDEELCLYVCNTKGCKGSAEHLKAEGF